MLVDRATIHVRSGKGGDGCVAFRREKYINKGGPSGGDGGNGGDVILVAEAGVDTLLDFTGRHHWRAPDGEPGGSKQKHGANGDDLEIRLPPGTLIYNDETGELVVDLAEPETRHVIAAGGRGGFGNEHFKSPTNQTPREATPGEPSVELTLRMELKLVADVGLIGMPNAGKSTLLSRLTAARPKIADYPFTTLEPNLGIAEIPGEFGARRLVIADIPGLIEGAHEGVGLGDDFLRHIERTRILVHVIDGSLIDPAEQLREINNELELFDSSLSEKPQIVALNKIDMPEVRDLMEDIAAALAKESEAEVLCISAAGREGLDALMDEVLRKLETTPSFNERAANRSAESELPVLRPRPRSTKPLVRKDADGVYVVESADAIRVAAMVDVRKWEARIQFYRRLQHTGIDQALIDAGIMPGDSVRIGEWEWEWE